MLQEIILGKDVMAPLDPCKTVFIVGAGISSDAPSSLPLGDMLTKAYLDASIGVVNREKFIRFWTEHFPCLERCVQGNIWEAPSYKPKWDVYPRLEFVIGQIDKLDKGLRNMCFKSPLLKKKYCRGSMISALRMFSKVEPNLCHYWLAEYMKAGATIITPNFDVGIEKALGVETITIEQKNGMQTCHGVYHYHNIATDPNLEKNLGATVKNISKGFPKEFKEFVTNLFEEGNDVVFLGYGGLDVFDVLPFFEEMKGGYSGRAIYVKHTSSNMYDAIVETPKSYLYLLKPFNNQYLVYGQTLDFFKKTKSEKKGITEPKPKLGSDSFTFIKTVDELRKEEIRLIKLDEEYPGLEALATYRFINLIRLCSQLTINPSHFYPDYDKRITKILDEWEQDDPAGFQQKLQDGESFTGEIKRSLWETKKLKRIKKRVNLPSQNHTNNLMPFLPISSRPAPKELVDKFIDMTVEILQKLQNNGNELDEDQMLIERATVHYLCGYKTQMPMLVWTLLRRPMRQILKRKQKQINRLLGRPEGHQEQINAAPFHATLFTYRTYYLGLYRALDLLDTMLNDKTYHGDLDTEWKTCMWVPDLMDAERKIRNLIHQNIVLLFRGVKPDFNKWHELYVIREKLRFIKRDAQL